MTELGLPVPPAFILSVEAYKQWRSAGLLPDEAIAEALAELEKEMGRKMGHGLEVSVRSSAAASMPGMMDTVLNIGDARKMKAAIRRIFESWDNLRAVEYRRLNKISPTLGTAAVIQAMVYGNRDEKSGTGVVFSRNPSTGEKGLFGEYLIKAQGEDLVSGTRTPQHILTLKSVMPGVYDELAEVANRLEVHFCDMQDIEFTIESGKLYMLQTRNAKRGGHAAVKVAVDMVKEERITPEEAVMRATVADIQGLLHKQLKGNAYKPVGKGLNAAPGAVGGKVVFDPLEALALSKKGIPVILVRPETSPDDIQGIAAAAGVLTQRGGLTSHAAIVTRAMGKPSIVGAEGIDIDVTAKRFKADGVVVHEGDEITIDGTTGYLYLGVLPVEEVSLTGELQELMSWADGFKRLGVKANADTPEMIAQARTFGAEGIGLCRTERMFNAPERLSVIREFILAENLAMRAETIEHLRELQTNDFMALFRELGGLPIIIRLLDLPLHEFLPPEHEVKDPRVRQRIAELKETNPMLGHRGVRLAVTSPELYQMQIEAIERARTEVPADVSVMIPQVITAQEAVTVKKLVKSSNLRVGVMIETVRACMRAGQLANEVDFFSFGTNDLTQAVYSFSREDAEKKFLSTYMQLGILQDNPFEVLDVKGVGRLMETAIFWARRAKKDLEIGVCGEHAGEPRSINYLHGAGVDYVSCSPFRIPVAKLVAAQAAIEGRTDKTWSEVPCS
ncbi:MAG: pyruvate, phosphate dikinase [Chloroflexi bacterium]|nr:pyruvate, phosphate dikinase [Chloroflexota bacterium]